MNCIVKRTAFLILLIFFNSCSKDVFTDVVENIVTVFGKIFVDSNPKGYKVYVDNRNTGVVTPDTVTFISEGLHKVTLKHDLYLGTTVDVNITKSNVGNIFLDMQKEPNFYANIYCTTIPSGAKIFLNDKSTNFVTPATIFNVYPGQIKLKFVKNNCRDDSVFVKVKSNERGESFRILEDTTRAVSYRTTNSGINSDVLIKVIVDKQNQKWIGSIDHGLMKYDGKNWISFERNSVINSNHITAMILDSRDRLWIGTSTGLAVFDGITWQSFSDKLPSKIVTSLKEDPNGNVWIGTTNGLVKYDNNQFQVFNSSNSKLPDNDISSITFSKTGTLWLGTAQHGVISFEKESWIIQRQLDKWKLDPAIGNSVNDLVFDNNGNLWAFIYGNPLDGKRSALVKLDWKDNLWYEIDPGVQFPIEILSFYVDKDNNIWMAAKEALVKYNENKPTKFYNTTDYGFYAKHCTSAMFDQSGNLWVTTMGGGIIKIKKNFL